MATFINEWSNWGQNIQKRPRQIFHPNTLQGLIAAIQKANSDDRRLRASGSQKLDSAQGLGVGPHTDGFSFSDVAICHDYVVELDQLKSVLAFFGPILSGVPGGVTFGHPGPATSPVLGAALLPNVASSARMFAHVQGGITLEQLFTDLDEPSADTAPPGPLTSVRGRWALPTLGGSAGQTLAGAISTSTHGGDFSIGPLTEMVRAIDLVAPDGNRFWIEPQSNQITNMTPQQAQLFFKNDPPIPTVIYADPLFFSALVAFGSMGVIHSLVIEVVAQFGLSQQVSTPQPGFNTWNTIKNLLRTGSMFLRPPWGGINTPAHPPVVVDTSGVIQNAVPEAWGLEIYINPYRISGDYYGDPNPDRNCVVVSRAKNSVFSIPQPLPTQPCILQALQDLIALNFLTHDAIQARPDINFTINNIRKPTPANSYPVAFSVANGGDGQSPALSMEIAVSTEDNGDIRFIDAMLERFDRIVSANLNNTIAGAFSLRYTMPSSAFMAMQNFSTPKNKSLSPVCHIEIPVLVANVVNGAGGTNNLASASAQHLMAFEELVNLLGAHLHWGMLSLTNAHNPSGYGFFEEWQRSRHFLALSSSPPKENRTFQNDFTVRYRITPTVEDWDVVGNGLLPQSTTAAPDSASSGIWSWPPTAFLDTLGFVEVFAVGSDGNVCWWWPEQGDWGLIQPTDPGNRAPLLFTFTERVAVANNAVDGHPEAFALDSASHQILHAWRAKVSDSHWQPWTALSPLPTGVSFVSSPDVAMGPGANLVVVARNADNQVYFNVQNGGLRGLGVVTWSGWNQIPAPNGAFPFAGDPCIGIDVDGTVEVFARDSVGNIWQTASPASVGSPTSTSWNPWTQLNNSASTITGDPAIGRDFSGNLQLFAVRGPTLFTLGQALPGQWAVGGTWFSMPKLPANETFDLTSRPSVTLRLDALHVAQILSDGNIAYFYQDPIVGVPPGQWKGMVVRCQSKNTTVHATSPPSLVIDDSVVPWVYVRTENDMVQFRQVVTYP
jgi:hypothetical protein